MAKVKVATALGAHGRGAAFDRRAAEVGVAQAQQEEHARRRRAGVVAVPFFRRLP